VGPRDVALYVGLAVVIFGALMWAFGRAQPDAQNVIKLPGGFEFTINTPAIGIMAVGVALVVISLMRQQSDAVPQAPYQDTPASNTPTAGPAPDKSGPAASSVGPGRSAEAVCCVAGRKCSWPRAPIGSYCYCDPTGAEGAGLVCE
jgi:hypothetical protein